MLSGLRDSPTALDDVRAWRAGTIDSSCSWHYALPDRLLEVLDRTIQELRRAPQPIPSIRVARELREAGAEAMQPVLAALESGRGFAIIDCVPLERYSAAESQLIYWLVGQLLGAPFEQNVQGTLLYDVRDTGQDVSQGARFSVTNYESSFHTDNSFGQEVLDYVGLLCLTTAKTGGLSQVLSGYAIYNELIENHRDVLETLGEPFHVDRRGGIRASESPTARFPIVQRRGPELLFRYLRHWIEVGHEKAGEPLTRAQIRALDTLDELLRRSDLRVEFALRPGEMFFINNRWILHNRTAFEDHPEPERRRHLARLWLKARR